MESYDSIINDCGTCMGHKCCKDWRGSLNGGSCTFQNYKYYANKEQVEEILKWHDEKYGTIQDRIKKESVENCDFRVGDDVFDICCGNGKVVSTKKRYPTDKYNIGVDFYNGKEKAYTEAGKNLDKDLFRSLYHGHDLNVTVDEKKPVRYVERWGFIYILDNGKIKSKFIYETYEQCVNELKLSCRNIVSDPIRIMIPACNK